MKNLPQKDRIVNFADPHPGIQTHKLAADPLYQEIMRLHETNSNQSDEED